MESLTGSMAEAEGGACEPEDRAFEVISQRRTENKGWKSPAEESHSMSSGT